MRLVTSTFVTLDGVVQSPGGPDEDRSGGFDRGGWLLPHFDQLMVDLVAEWTAMADGLLLGRRTYEIFAAQWPAAADAADPIAARMNSVPKFVVSTTLDQVAWNNTTLVRGHVVDAVAALKREPGSELQVQGSAELLQTLIEHELLDELRLWFVPVLLGKGKRLFGRGTLPTTLELVDTTTSTTGVVISTYRPATEI